MSVEGPHICSLNTLKLSSFPSPLLTLSQASLQLMLEPSQAQNLLLFSLHLLTIQVYTPCHQG